MWSGGTSNTHQKKKWRKTLSVKILHNFLKFSSKFTRQIGGTKFVHRYGTFFLFIFFSFRNQIPELRWSSLLRSKPKKKGNRVTIVCMWLKMFLINFLLMRLKSSDPYHWVLREFYEDHGRYFDEIINSDASSIPSLFPVEFPMPTQEQGDEHHIVK
jgi:hypothetical protein